MDENGVAYVWLHDKNAAVGSGSGGNCNCGCTDPNCGCQDPSCGGNCCVDKGCGDHHNFTLLESIKPTCLTLGYDRYLCVNCGKVEKRDYEAALGHDFQSIEVYPATCEENGIVLDICSRCGKVEEKSTPKGEHKWQTSDVPATCISSGYTLKECSVCHERHITNITEALPHNYEPIETPATCLTSGQILHVCSGCGSSFTTDYKEPLGHDWDEGTVIHDASCIEEGLIEYRCKRCDITRIEGGSTDNDGIIHDVITGNGVLSGSSVSGHIPGASATCTTPQICTHCGIILASATGHSFASVTMAPTCLTMGYTTHTCTKCAYSYKSDYVDSLGHSWDNGKAVVNSTCNGKGMKEYSCTRCDAYYTESESAAGHTPGAAATCTEPQVCTACGAVLAKPTGHTIKSTVTAATCTTMGFTTNACQNCNFEYTDKLIDQLGHHYVEKVTAPTCTEQGFTTYTCDRCKDTYVSDYKAALDHKWDEGKVIVNSTCNGKGMTQYTCQRCDEIRVESESAEGHTPGTAATCTEPQLCTVCKAVLAKPTGHNLKSEKTAPTCTTIGYTTHTCKTCDYSYKDEYVDALGHNYKETVTAPTCLKQGYTTHTCERCGDSYVTDYKDPTGHKWDGGTVVVNSTCNGSGMTEYRCENCDAIRLESESAEGHTPGAAATCTEPQVCTTCGAVLNQAFGHHFVDKVKAPTCTEGGYTTHACERCDANFVTDYKDALGHNWDNGTVVVNSTCNGKGMIEYKCSHCDAHRIESEEATGHTPGEPATCTEPQLCTVCNAVLEKATGHSFTDKVTAPTCLKGGYTTHSCDICGEGFVTDYTDPTGHDWDEGTIIHNATCTGESLKEYRCKNCDEKRYENNASAGHTPGEPATCTEPQTCTKCGAIIAKATGHNFKPEVTEPTCTTMGFTNYVCENCGFVYQGKYEQQLGHRFTTTVTEPTCLEQGFTTHVCDRCGLTYIDEYTDALGHDWDDGTTYIGPTCNGEGMKEYRCRRCDYHRMESESPEGHTPGAPATCLDPQVCTVCGAVLENATGHSMKTEVTPETCLEMGFTTYSCENCDFSYKSDYIKPLGHNHVPTVTDPTCLEKGFTTYTCDRCGDSYIADYTDALGHEWDEGTPVTSKTCKGEGVVDYRCVRCDYHRLQAASAEGHTPGAEATCTTPQLCTECGAVLVNELGHDYQSEVTDPTCLAMGFTTNTCTRCNDVFQDSYTDATGHTMSDWIVDKEATFDDAGSRHKECTVCGETLETEVLTKLYLTAVTDTHGEAVIGAQTIIVTDTDTKNPVIGATVTLDNSGKISIRLPDGRLLDYADQTTVTVLLTEDKAPVKDVITAMTDKNGNSCGAVSDANGQITVPNTNGKTDENGNLTVGGTDANGNRFTFTITVVNPETNRPVGDADVSLGETGNITITLPNGTNMDDNHHINVNVTDQNKTPQNNITVILKNDQNKTATDKTNKDGEVIVPGTNKAYTDEKGGAVVGKYTVVVTDTNDKPVEKALVTLLTENGVDRITVLLPDGRLLDGNDRTVVTVYNPDATPVKDMEVRVDDAKDNHATKNTDINGKVIVPEMNGSSGEILGGETVDKDDSITASVEVSDKDGKPVEDAKASVDKKGNVTVTLPDDFPLDPENPVTVTTKNNKGEPTSDVAVTVKNKDGNTIKGETDENGKVTLPGTAHSAYIFGYPDNTVRPNGNMTRAEAATIFARLLAEHNGEEPDGGYRTSFSDIGKAWYCPYVSYLEINDLINGYQDGTFGGNDKISRAEFVALCNRFNKAVGGGAAEDIEKLIFSDVRSNHWALSDIREAAAQGWVEGYNDLTFKPDKDITRAEACKMVNHLLGRVADEEYIDDNVKSLIRFDDLRKNGHWAYYDIMEAANTHQTVINADAEMWQ